MEKDWKADLLLVQKLMGSRRIGSKKLEDLEKMQTYSVHFSRKIKTQNKEKEEKKTKMKKKQVAGILCSGEDRKDAISLKKQT
jgi:hypothetical protein